jgi:hypothetical protein
MYIQYYLLFSNIMFGRALGQKNGKWEAKMENGKLK